MSQKVDAWMPLWIGAYLADTASLSRDEHGGYLLLLMAYWRNKGPLVDRGNALANIVKATPSEWRSRLRPVMAQFFDIDGEQWLHGRAEKELLSAGLRKAAAVSKAQAAAEARWKNDHKQSPKQPAKHAPSIPQALPEDCPTPSPSNPSQPSVKKGARKALAPECPGGVDPQVWTDWLALRKAKRAPVSATAIAGAIEQATLAGMSLDAFLRIWCRRGTQGLEAAWLKPEERAKYAAAPEAEPAWRTEQRERNREALGPFAAKNRRPANVIDITPTEGKDASASLLG